MNTPIQTVFQNSPAESGAACLCMILNYYGKNITIKQLIEESTLAFAGHSAGDIMRTAKQLGLECHGFKRNVYSLRETKFPAIIHWCYNHFIVLEGIDDTGYGEYAYVNDPAIGRIRINFASLVQNYTGTVLEFSTK